MKYESGRSGNQILLCSGADIPATYALSCLMSTLYRKFDKSYADLCLAKAKVAFEFARKKIEAGRDNNPIVALSRNMVNISTIILM